MNCPKFIFRKKRRVLGQFYILISVLFCSGQSCCNDATAETPWSFQADITRQGVFIDALGSQLHILGLPQAVAATPEHLIWATIGILGFRYLLPKSDAPVLFAQYSALLPYFWSLAGQISYWGKGIWDESYFITIPLLIENPELNKKLAVRLLVDTYNQQVHWEIYRKAKSAALSLDTACANNIHDSLNDLWLRMNYWNVDLLQLYWEGDQWVFVEFAQNRHINRGDVQFRADAKKLEAAILQKQTGADTAISLLHPVIINQLIDPVYFGVDTPPEVISLPEMKTTTGEYATMLSPQSSDNNEHLIWLREPQDLSATPVLSLMSGDRELLSSNLNQPGNAAELRKNGPWVVSSGMTHRLQTLVADMVLIRALDQAGNQAQSGRIEKPADTESPSSESGEIALYSPPSQESPQIVELFSLQPVISGLEKSWQGRIQERGGGSKEQRRTGGKTMSSDTGQPLTSAGGWQGGRDVEEFDSSSGEESDGEGDPPSGGRQAVSVLETGQTTRKRSRSFEDSTPDAKRSRVDESKKNLIEWQYNLLQPVDGQSGYLQVITDVINSRLLADEEPQAHQLQVSAVHSRLRDIYQAIEGRLRDNQKKSLVGSDDASFSFPDINGAGPEFRGLIYLAFNLWFIDFEQFANPSTDKEQNILRHQIDKLRQLLLDEDVLDQEQLWQLSGLGQKVILLETDEGFESWHGVSTVRALGELNRGSLNKYFMPRLLKRPESAVPASAPDSESEPEPESQPHFSPRDSEEEESELQRQLKGMQSLLSKKDEQVWRLKEGIHKRRASFHDSMRSTNNELKSTQPERDENALELLAVKEELRLLQRKIREQEQGKKTEDRMGELVDKTDSPVRFFALDEDPDQWSAANPETTIQALEARVEEYTEQLKEYEQKVEAAKQDQKQYEAQKAELESLKEVSLTKSGLLEKKEEALAKLQAELTASKNNLARIQVSQNDEKASLRKGFDEAFSKQRKALEDMQQEKISLQKKLAENSVKLLRQEGVMAALITKQVQAQQIHSQAIAVIGKKKEEEKQALQKELESKQRELNKIEKSRNELQEQVDQKQAALADLKLASEAKAEEISSLKQQLGQREKQLQEALELERTKQRKALEDMQQEKISLQKELAKNNIILLKQQGVVAELMASQEQTRQRYSQAISVTKAKEAEKQALQKELESKQRELNKIEKSRNELQEQVDQKQAALDENKVLLTAARKDAEQSAKTVEALRKDLDNEQQAARLVEKAVADLKLASEAKAEEISNLKQQLEQREKQLQAARQSSEALQRDLPKVQVIVSAVSEQLNQVKSTVAEKEGIIARLETEKQKLGQKLDTRIAANAMLSLVEPSTVSQEQARLQEALDKSLSELARSTQEKEAIEEKVSELEKALGEAREFGEKQERLYKKERREAKKAASRARTEINEERTKYHREVTVLKQELDSLRTTSRINKKQAVEIDSLQIKLGTLEQKLAKMTKQKQQLARNLQESRAKQKDESEQFQDWRAANTQEQAQLKSALEQVKQEKVGMLEQHKKTEMALQAELSKQAENYQSAEQRLKVQEAELATARTQLAELSEGQRQLQELNERLPGGAGMVIRLIEQAPHVAALLEGFYDAIPVLQGESQTASPSSSLWPEQPGPEDFTVVDSYDSKH